jgi:hypothetical protein
MYCVRLPLFVTQYVTVPNPMIPGNENFYPLSFFMAAVWIWLYSLIIVWFTFEITMSFNLHFSIIPLFLYSIGIALRDQKKF